MDEQLTYKERIRLWKEELFGHKYLIILSIALLLLAVFLNYITGNYVSEIKTIPVPDMVLDNIPPIDLSFIFVWGYIFIILVLIVYPLFFDTKQLHVAISQFSLLLAVRAIFITFTHLQAPVGAINVSFPWIFGIISFKNDLFFSGHVAVCVLGFFLFRGHKIKHFFLISSFIMATTVLLMHVHYTIDVAAAFFITFGIYKFGTLLFKKFEEHYPSKHF